MGLPDTGFPRKLFSETIKAIPVAAHKSPIEELEHRLAQLLAFGNEHDLKKIAAHDNARLKEVIELLTEHSYELDAFIDET
ncbi:hypothetical protein ACT691_03575 [Vibrio metschnikovii]